MNPLRINNNKRLKNPVSMRIFDICKKKNSHLVHRSCRGGTSFLCRQRKDAKRTQRGESCFPPLNPLQGHCGGSPNLAREVCRLTERRPPAQIAGILQGYRSPNLFVSDQKTKGKRYIVSVNQKDLTVYFPFLPWSEDIEKSVYCHVKSRFSHISHEITSSILLFRGLFNIYWFPYNRI